MTLKPIEDAFSEALFHDAAEPAIWDLTLDGRLFHRQHPKVLLATLQYEREPNLELPDPVIPGWKYECYETFVEAERKHPDLTLKFRGQPWAIGSFLKSGAQAALIDFSPLGAVYLTQGNCNRSPLHKLCEHTLPHFLSYALSPEMWGPAGKWPRFHHELNQIFSQKNLLIRGDSPGHYLLKENASLIERAGFLGTHQDKSYLIVLPWTFSLTGLKKLVEFVRQEF